MSAFKTTKDLFAVGDDDDDDDDDDEQPSEEEEESDDDDDDAAPAAAAAAASAKGKPKKSERDWLAENFIKQQKTGTGIVYKTDLLPDKVFFSREKLGEFVKGKRYKRLLREMRKGMRTHEEETKLKQKADARRERLNAKKEAKKQAKKDSRKEKRKLDGEADGDAAEIERRKASFQAKKARRLARKQAAAES